MAQNGKKPKTIFDLIEGRGYGSHRSTKHDLTLEQALAQVDEKFGGDEELKQLYRELYSHKREIPTEQE